MSSRDRGGGRLLEAVGDGNHFSFSFPFSRIPFFCTAKTDRIEKVEGKGWREKAQKGGKFSPHIPRSLDLIDHSEMDRKSEVL